MRFWLAIRAFFAVLFSSLAAERIRRVLTELRQQRAEDVLESKAVLEQSGTEAALAPAKVPAKATRPPAPKGDVVGRSEALSLLAALQREARLVDLIQEPLQQYTDAQIGAAARDVLRNAAKTLERFFGLKPVVSAEEGAAVEVPRGFDPNRYRLIGHVVGEPPYRGQLVHPGWEAARCELPSWTGSESAARVIAPAEVEILPPSGLPSAG